mmetsp:Transcript_32730/g.90379  ORF Transcript_32730/g.90379 Transcript_32730/m.90379 type:complete len:207 (-) Transcript_32730:1791-2411(-)
MPNFPVSPGKVWPVARAISRSIWLTCSLKLSSCKPLINGVKCLTTSVIECCTNGFCNETTFQTFPSLRATSWRSINPGFASLSSSVKYNMATKAPRAVPTLISSKSMRPEVAADGRSTALPLEPAMRMKAPSKSFQVRPSLGMVPSPQPWMLAVTAMWVTPISASSERRKYNHSSSPTCRPLLLSAEIPHILRNSVCSLTSPYFAW